MKYIRFFGVQKNKCNTFHKINNNIFEKQIRQIFIFRTEKVVQCASQEVSVLDFLFILKHKN